MANHTGVEGVIKIGANAVAEVRSFTISINGVMISTKKLGDTWETVKAGIRSWSVKAQAFWDETDTNGQAVLQAALIAGTAVTLNLYPEGATTGDAYFTGSAFIESMDIEVSDNDAIIGASFSFKGNGALTPSTA